MLYFWSFILSYSIEYLLILRASKADVWTNNTISKTYSKFTLITLKLIRSRNTEVYAVARNRLCDEYQPTAAFIPCEFPSVVRLEWICAAIGRRAVTSLRKWHRRGVFRVACVCVIEAHEWTPVAAPAPCLFWRHQPPASIMQPRIRNRSFINIFRCSARG